MSGPKYSRAYIRELQRLKQLQKTLEDQLENTKRKQILADIERIQGDMHRECPEALISECDKMISEIDGIIPESKTLAQIKSIIATIHKIQDEKCDKKGNSDSLLAEYNRLQGELIQLKNAYFLLKDLKKILVAEATEAVQTRKLEEFMAMEWVDTEEKISTVPVDLQELYYEVINLLSSMPNFENNRQMLDETIMMTADYDYKRRQLELRKQAILVEANSSQDNVEMLNKTYELRGLYELLGWEAKAIPNTLEEVCSAIEEANRILQQEQASRYVAECIHRVFAEKGYSLLEDSVVSNNTGAVKKGLYEFGEDSLISVSMSDKGQMLFEVVGDGSEAGMDESRAEKLESEMRRFCPNYAEIKRCLEEEFGISLEDEHLCEPDKKYARAVDTSVSKSERRAQNSKKLKHFDD